MRVAGVGVVAVAVLVCALAVTRVSAEQVNCVHGAYPPPSGYALPWATVSLDDDPQHRWDSVVVPRAAAIRDLLNTAMSILPSVLQKDLLDRLHTHLADKVKYMPAPIADELIGIAAASGLDVGEVMLYNIFYEVFSVCTSIVAQDAQGNIHHARNLDFGLFMGYDFHNHSWAVTEKLRPLLVNVEWTQGGKVLFRSTQYAGYVGVLTGMRQNLFAITIDSRFDDKFDRGLINWLDGNHTASWVSLVTRAALVSADTFEEAVQTLSTTPLVAPVYYIISGVKAGEGAVITRWVDQADLYTLQERIAAGTFYVLETNYDHWKKPLFIDDRRDAAMKCMNATGSANIATDTLFDVLATRPVLNQLTTYAALMRADIGQFETYMQYCPPPCPLF